MFAFSFFSFLEEPKALIFYFVSASQFSLQPPSFPSLSSRPHSLPKGALLPSFFHDCLKFACLISPFTFPLPFFFLFSFLFSPNETKAL
jgi:hypothetical protein